MKADQDVAPMKLMVRLRQTAALRAQGTGANRAQGSEHRAHHEGA